MRGIFTHIIQTFVAERPVLNVIILGVAYIFDKLYINIDIASYLYILYFAYAFLYLWADDEMKKLHGAEHASLSYYDEYSDIDIKDYETIKNCEIYYAKCGTTSMIFTPIIFIALSLFINDFIIKYIIILSIVGEIYYCIEVKRLTRIISPLIFISKFIQVHICLKRPDIIHVQTAIAAIKELEKIDTN